MITRLPPSCDEHENHDGCLCHAPVTVHDATPDRELPEATGGVEGDEAPLRKVRRTSDRTSVKGEA